MPSKRINKEESNNYYFLTFTIKNWYYILDRYERWNILAESLNYCVENKGLKIYAYVFMINHLHLLVYSPDVQGFVRDFKKYTSFRIFKNINETEPSIIKLFRNEPPNNFQLWAKTNMPKLVTSNEFMNQKIDYIHNNPVKRSYVIKPEYWYWSSANPESGIKTTQPDII